MVRAQLTSTITMSSRDRSETITSGFAAGLASPPRLARRAADPVVVMDAPPPCPSTVLRSATARGRTPATAHSPDGLALSYSTIAAVLAAMLRATRVNSHDNRDLRGADRKSV